MSPEIRPVHAHLGEEILWLATRMRRTLMEVLGDEAGESLYSMEWLERRVGYHLGPHAQIFVSALPDGERVGYTIVRREEPTLGLFSTTYVEPAWRRRGVARALLQKGEEWMRELGLLQAATYTAETNTRLHHLYLGNGYQLFPGENGFVKLLKTL